jgi:hypothetical protein
MCAVWACKTRPTCIIGAGLAFERHLRFGDGSAATAQYAWSRLGVWERLLVRAQDRGVQLGMTFLDGTSVRAR